MQQQRSGAQAYGSPQRGSPGKSKTIKKQMQSSGVPRFNPHPPEEPPQERVVEKPTNSPVKKLFGKKKNQEEEKVDFSQFDLEQLLLEQGVEFRNPEKAIGGWLPLEAYDDKEFDTRRPVDWLSEAEENAEGRWVGAQGLWKDKDGLCYWRRVRISKFLPKSERFEGHWENTKEKCRLHRVHCRFDAEDPRIFVRRFKAAYTSRVYADSLIKYNYYVENMPTHQIPEIDTEQVNRVLSMTQNTKSLRGKSSADTTTLLSETNFDFAKTMNKIIFDKHLNEKGNELITGNLKLPPKPPKKLPPFMGMISIPPHNFPSKFSEFCHTSLDNRDEAVLAKQEIKKECDDVRSKDIYNPNITTTMRMDEFQTTQASTITQTSFYLKETWVSKIRDIIKNNFQNCDNAWFNLNESSREIYQMGKLKKFMQVVRFMMENTLLYMTQDSVRKFTSIILDFVPEGVTVKDSYTVYNTFNAAFLEQREGGKPPPPLFNIDLMLYEEELEDGAKVSRPGYSTSPRDIVKAILQIFDMGIKSLQEVTQVEQKLLGHLYKNSTKIFLKAAQRPDVEPPQADPEDPRQLPDENQWLWDEYNRLQTALEKSILPLEEFLHTFDNYDEEYRLDVDAYVKKQASEDDYVETDELKKDVYFHRGEVERIKSEILDHVVVSMFQVQTSEIRQNLADKHVRIANEEIEIIASRAKAQADEILKVFAEMNAKIEKKPTDIEDLTAIKEFMATVPNELEKIQVDITQTLEVYSILEEFQYKFHDQDDYEKKWILYGSPKETLSKIEKQTVSLNQKKDQFIKEMVSEQQAFKGEVQEIEKLVFSFNQHQDQSQYEDIAAMTRTIHQRLQECLGKAKTFNHREMLVELPDSDYTDISQMNKEFMPFYNLWTTIDLFRKSHKSWLEDDFNELDAGKLEEIVENSFKTLNGTARVFKEKEPNIQKICLLVKDEVEAFKPYVPIALGIREQGMKERHWEAISEKCGFKVEPYEGITFQNFMEMFDKDLEKCTEACVDIGEKAGKEFQIETSLEKMQSDWKSVDFRLKPFKKTGTSTVLGFDDAMALLDEHLVITQTMQFSPFKKPFEEEIEEWSNALLNVGNVIEEWVKCQGSWMYLQPIFDSPDIMKQLHYENKKFKSVDKMWRKIISKVDENPNVLIACNREGLFQDFKDANENLERVQRGLNEYLEQKRSIFARFYFLSNSDLLEILSQTKEVENVRPHLRKVFENMADLEFHEDKTIHAMFSGEGEKIDFDSQVDPNNKGVEWWMGEVEDSMITNVRLSLLRSIEDYKTKDRTEWILQHPGQCVLNGSQVHWTQEAEDAIKAGLAGIQKYVDFLNTQLLETVGLVRQKLTKLQSITLGALIVIDVHAMDVIQGLVDAKIDDVNAFEWISQLRYYWEEDNCRVKCIQTNFPYGYEYLGNSQRLVITPLTDKCYMTLMGALRLNLGGAPAGPAGTGKTESTKDLAKALAKQCVVFNCSDGMDYLMVGRFFKGLASAGAWACFDEFNRINIEVLSVIAQQLLHLFGCKAKGEKETIFEESQIRIQDTFSVFITMNPGYAGRTELPDNLKALFRPVAMMVPDYALIGQIMLYSFGFNQAKILATKMVTTFKLCSEQLSSQDHYDYGMRAVRSVINAAGLLKRATPDMNEDQLLLRALRDVNVPKFLKDDLPLFEGIMSDLFPGVEKPQTDQSLLLNEINATLAARNLQPHQPFIDKIIQLYDTIQVRHGLMLVGPTGGGKTSNYKSLAQACSNLRKAKAEGFEKVHYHILNPKSITMGQLYGDIDPQTSEWIDGVLAIQILLCTRDQSPEKHWVMFDGPVDAIWIENMNTVLDDNKKLCLNSGQIITLTDRMTMMFEVEDLAVASPATVSRCGMVYMEPGALGLEPLVKSWLNTVPRAFKERKGFLKELERLVTKYMFPAVKFMKKNCPEPVPTMENNIASSMLRILDCFFAPYEDTEIKKTSPEEAEQMEQMLEPHVVFALVWSIGCTTTMEGRERFDRKLRELTKDSKMPVPEGSFYNYTWKKDASDWVDWSTTQPPYAVDSKAAYGDIVVPTFDSIRMKFLKKLLLMQKKHVLCPGPTGTGKTINITQLVTQEMSEDYQTIPITFSAQTSANQTQNALDEKMDKRRKGIYGPPTGKRFIIFVDDLNMPKKEEYGAQPPIELLRQWMDHQGWYDLKQKEKPFMKIEDIIFVCAMGPPGGGRSALTRRLERHFNIMTYTNLERQSIANIFETILKSFIGPFSEEIQEAVPKIVESTQKVYNFIATTLKPTPNKSHYTFNLRDMSKIFGGVCSADKKQTSEVVDIIRLWIHENKRVFGDRMVSSEDKNTLDDMLNEEALKVYNLEKEQIYEAERIIFGDYMQGIDMEGRPYNLIKDLKLMQKKIEEYLDDYNAGSKHPMRLVMFLDACDHVNRICRVLRQPQGNALLLGVGGSGRQSLARLAAYISNQKTYQIEVVKGYSMTMWRDNLKSCLIVAGCESKPTMFLFCDTQIINEQMLEDINNVLNSGDVPGLYKNEDFEEIYKVGKMECSKKGLPVNKMNMFSCYLGKVKANIHVVLAMSPLGEVFRGRLRKFPSLVNCCTLDWFTEWPEEALKNVAHGSLIDEQESLGKDFDSCVEMFKCIHQSVEAISERFLAELRRYNYVTPTSYLELLSAYKSILKERQTYFHNAKTRLERGLKVLLEASVEVANLQDSLEKKKPKLKETQIQVEKTKVIIERDTKEADATKTIVAAEEAEAAEKEAEVTLVKNDADADLAVALPMLEEAVKKVRNMSVADLVELKAVNTPSPTVVRIFEMVYYMLKDAKNLSKPKKPNDPKKREYDPDGFFDLAKREILNNPKDFLNSMVEYDRDNIPDSLVAKVEPMMQREEVSEKKVQVASQALLPVRIWIAAMIKYHEVLKVVNPKRAVAAEMTAKLEIVQAQLNEKREKVREINEKLAQLNANMQDQINLQNQLNQEIIDCGTKLTRAEKLIGGLQGEKDRWTETVKTLGERQLLLVGDCMVATGMVSYAGPFTAEYRAELEEKWRQKLKELEIAFTEGVSMKDVIGDPVTIRSWNVAGLPNDSLSVENGIILFKARRWPLMIDPQTQANKFIKKLGEGVETGCEVFKMSETTLLRNLELAIQFGKWVLLENIGEELDPALEPILLQQKIKQGSSYIIKIGEKNIMYNDSFRFFMTTTLPNPHYSPETSVKVTILNFAITPQGLEDQMLNQFVGLEMPELQEKKDEIVQQNAKSAVILRDIEDKILEGLTKHDNIAAILETDELIEVLSESKKTSQEIAERQKESEVTEKEIDQTRESFRSVAYRASLLFFCIVDLANIDPMYQYSLQWFQMLFGRSVKNSQPAPEVKDRIRILNSYQTLALYQNVCRSLFEKDKLLFSFLLTVKILFGDKAIDPAEWRFFLAGPSGSIDIAPNPTDWLDDLEWSQVYRQLYIMAQLPAFAGVDTYFIEYHKKFKKIFDATEAHLEPMPGEWDEKLNSFQKMILLKAVRSDKISQAIQNFIIEKLGQDFVEPPTFDLGACFRDSSHLSPLIFVLSAGSDPVADFKKFAEEAQMTQRLDMISLGQGQAEKAEKMIATMQSSGGWVLLQNCHLAESWMGSLERIVEQLNDEIHPDFRMWMTSMPSKKFPVAVLQNSIKMTLEPPNGLKANLSRTYTLLDNRTLNDCEKPELFKKILFGFAFFHAIVQDRRKFGPIGWNIPYAFTKEDFDVCFKQLKLFLDEYEKVPYKVLNFLGAEINYGGRVTDEKDKRLISTILGRFIDPGMVTDGFKYSESGIYKTIEAGGQEDYLKYIKELPLNPHPEAFGLHENAEITTNMDATRRVLEQVLSIQPRSSAGAGKTREQIIIDIAIDIESKTPAPFDLEAVQEKYPTEYTESMNTVLCQEVIRYNRLLRIMADNLKNLQRAVKGEVVMSEDLEKVANSMFDNQVPGLWASKGFLSLKPLASWIIDLNDRVQFVQRWIEGGTPKVFWISGFFFPQAFFTGTLQNYARKHVIAINELSFESKIYDDISYSEVTEKPEDGCYIYGMYLEGARWNSTTHMLDESKPKKLYTELPMAWFYPKRNRQTPEDGFYNCPVYKVLSRAGTLSTTGHSTNYVLMMELASDQSQQKWIMAGVALFLALRY